MIAAAGVLRWAIVGLYDEPLLLLKANLLWFLLSLPLGLPLLLLLLGLFPAVSPEAPPDWLLPGMLSGLLLLVVPHPASLGMCSLAATMTGRDSPPLADFLTGVRAHARLGLALFAIGLSGTLLLAVNLGFYLSLRGNLLQLVAVLWVYLLLFWLLLQLYLAPLVLLLGERRLLHLYRRAAVLVLAHPIYTLTLLLAICGVVVLCVLAWPLFPTFTMALTSLTCARALDLLRRRYGPDPDQEPS